jgi:MFS family permease
MKWNLRPEAAPLTAVQIGRGQRWIIACSVISILFGVGISDRVIALFILRINPAATDATLAFFFAIGPLLSILTALMSPWVSRRGKKRTMVPLYLAGLPFLVVLAILPSFLRAAAPHHLVVAVALTLTGYGVCRALGIAGWFPAINDNVPDEIRGRFFGKLRTSWQLMVVAYTALAGWFLGRHPAAWQFQVLFGVSILANLAMSYGITFIPEAPLATPPAGASFWRELAAPFRDRLYARFLLFGALFNLAVGLSGPFALRCMKHTLGAGDNFVIWMDTVASIGAAATLPLWGRLVDRFGGRAIFALMVPAFALLNLLWLLAAPAAAGWPVLVGAFFLGQGTFIFGIGVGITDMMLGGAHREHASAYMNIALVLNTVAAGAGPFLGTAITAALAGTADWHAGPLTLDANRWVFVCRCLLMLAALAVVPGLSREHGGRVGEALQRISSEVLNLIPFFRR